eukprot:3624645-Rhodomonas_salina.3
MQQCCGTCVTFSVIVSRDSAKNSRAPSEPGEFPPQIAPISADLLASLGEEAQVLVAPYAISVLCIRDLSTVHTRSQYCAYAISVLRIRHRSPMHTPFQYFASHSSIHNAWKGHLRRMCAMSAPGITIRSVESAARAGVQRS